MKDIKTSRHQDIEKSARQDVGRNGFKLLRSILLLAVLLVVLDIVYRYTFYDRDLREGCTLMERSLKPVGEQADIAYLGESSNHTVAEDEEDKRFISDMLQDLMPSHRVCNMDKDACHAGIYYDILRNIPKDNPVKVAVVTVNLRSFSAEWLYSSLEVPLQKEQVFMRCAPALYKRMLLAFKGYAHWSEKEREEKVKHALRHQGFDPVEGVPYRTAAEWDKALYNSMTAAGVDETSVSMATHYVKAFACKIDDRNPRIRDLDRIVKLCKRRGWMPIFLILPDNEEQMAELVGPGLVELLRRNGNYIEQRYSQQGVTVVNCQGMVPDAEFRDRDFPTEHYRQAGRQAIAYALYNALYSTPWELHNPYTEETVRINHLK